MPTPAVGFLSCTMSPTSWESPSGLCEHVSVCALNVNEYGNACMCLCVCEACVCMCERVKHVCTCEKYVCAFVKHMCACVEHVCTCVCMEKCVDKYV